MGEISEMMLDGTLDMYTGEYIGEPTGFPRSTRDEHSNNEKLRGVMSYMGNKGITSKKQRRELLEEFFGDFKGQKSNIELAVHASENFGRFVKFVQKKLLTLKAGMEASNG